MIILQVLYQFARADFLERVRRTSFFITLLATLGLSYLAVPPNDSRIITVALQDIRGVYNTPWVAAMLSIMCATFLSLIGFYLVKNALDRDRRTRVGQILESSPTSPFVYLLGKALSNFLLLACIVGVIMLSAVIMQFVRGEDTSLSLVHLVAPFLFMTLPYMAVIAALAVLFEAVPFLSGSAGNVIYYFVWTFILLVSISPIIEKGQQVVPAHNDVAGMTILLNSMSAEATRVYPDYNGDIQVGAHMVKGGELKRRITWTGVDWTVGIVVKRMFWLLVAVGIVAGATLPYRWQSQRERKLSKKQAREQLPDAGLSEAVAPVGGEVHLADWTYHPTFGLFTLVKSELRLALKGVSRWWYLAIAGMIVAQLVTPYEVSRHFLLTISWILPLAIWSALGCRDKILGTEDLIVSLPYMTRRQLPALIMAGATVMIIAGVGTLVRELIAGDAHALFAWLCAVIAIPMFAVGFGTITGGRKIFEILYIMVWYAGPINGLVPLDYCGAVATNNLPMQSIVFVVLAFIVVILAWTLRVRRAA